MEIDVKLSVEEAQIISNMIRFMDGQNVGADELLDCSYEVYNDLSDKIDGIMIDVGL